MNSKSSRSHVIFTMYVLPTLSYHIISYHIIITPSYLNGENRARNIAVEGRLNLVDLAGSERLDRSHSTGEARDEAISINKSLSALSNVFINIRMNKGFVNFRDSKLTMLLKDCLSKEGKTLMFVNLSPTVESAQESICALKFASTANQCKMNNSIRKVHSLYNVYFLNKQWQRWW